MTQRSPHLIGVDGPAVLVPARIAAILERHADLTALRVRTRGVDPEASAVLEALRVAAMTWRGSATGTEGAPKPEPAQDSNQWLSTGEAADLAGVTSRAIRKAIEGGRLQATEIGGRYRISREDLEQFKAARAA
ncbi:helix-turn-helix domain-containing protein [Nocardioides sp. Iso805N]|uniref:helix-turn-helix domain-containing protein n=1 Tax=Nocardioides sp. Iso805N TaxID=1283287 RepID=UPI00039DD87A|nr:helix-turn-helix domain-containing protein [Nocardioides sp. Iso805N]